MNKLDYLQNTHSFFIHLTFLNSRIITGKFEENLKFAGEEVLGEGN